MPCELCASLNDWADLRADEAAARSAPASIVVPAGGTRFYLEHTGRMVIGDLADHIRMWYLAAAAEKWQCLPVQGFVAQWEGRLWDMDLVDWRAARVPEGLTHIALELRPTWVPGSAFDAHAWLFKIRHGIGGSYVSVLKRDDQYHRIAHAIANNIDPDGHLCPLCGVSDGTR